MFVGPIFTREAATTPRRPRLFLFRSLYVTVLMVLMCTAWLSLAGTQIINNVGDLAQFGSILFQILALIQLAMMVFLSGLFSVIAVAREKDRKTLTLLLMTRMSNHELVLGKLFASLLNVFVMLAAALPLFMSLLLFGGVSIEQILRVFAVTFTSAIVVGSLGCMLAFWRENTFQTLSMTALGLVFWIGIWEAIGLLDGGVLGVPFATWATSFSPLSAVWAAASPFGQTESVLGVVGNGVNMFLITALSGAALINVVTILRVRVWNPSREVQRVQREETQASIWGAQHDLEADALSTSNGADSRDQVAEVARASHVDARVKTSRRKSRRVWDNPVLWRGVRTQAHGRKVILIRAAYFLLFAMAAVALHLVVRSAADTTRSVRLPPSAILTLFTLVSIVLVTALAVTSVTNERDGQALDLLLVSDLSSKEFVFGKLGGVFWVTREMIMLPMLLCVYLWSQGALPLEELIYLLGGLIILNLFAGTLGLHCGMIYANSRTAFVVSLGTVFFLFLGVATCILIMISFTGSFQTQLLPFLAFILGGGIALYVSLGVRNPSRAILIASIALPIATFFAITNLLLDPPRALTVFLVTATAYGFTTAAMLIPAIGEFDIAMGRTKTAEEE